MRLNKLLSRRYVLTLATVIEIIASSYGLGAVGGLLLARHGVVAL